MQNMKYLIPIIFIATSFHTAFGMDAEKIDLQDSSFPITTPYLPVKPKSSVFVYIANRDQLLQRYSSEGTPSTPKKLPFLNQTKNACTIKRSPNSYGIFKQESNSLILKNFELSLPQLDAIESSCTQQQQIIIVHDNVRYDICEIQKNGHRFEDQLTTCKTQLLTAQQSADQAMMIVDQHHKTIKTSVDTNKNYEGLIRELRLENKNYSEALKHLQTKFDKFQKESADKDEHYKKITHDNKFLKTIFGLALLGILCHYFDFVSKIRLSQLY